MRTGRARLIAAALSAVVFLVAWFGFDSVGADCGDTPSGFVCNGRADAVLVVAYGAIALLVLILVWEGLSRIRAHRRLDRRALADRANRSA